MAISCPGCSRQYDVTLFQFGRTINCACGRRVGLENRIELPERVELRFFADVMMHRLVRLLRALGFDTAWEDAIPDGELVRRSLIEHRHILTLDRRLTQEWSVANVLLLESENAREQLRQVLAHFGIKRPPALFTRCLVCNTLLRQATEAEIAAQSPEKIREEHDQFRFCPTCRKLYWPGSHTDRLRAILNAAITPE